MSTFGCDQVCFSGYEYNDENYHKQLTGVENKYVINYAFLAISFSASENDKVLAKLRGGMTVPS